MWATCPTRAVSETRLRDVSEQDVNLWKTIKSRRLGWRLAEAYWEAGKLLVHLRLRHHLISILTTR